MSPTDNMTPLSDDVLAELLAGSRGRGTYDEAAEEFIQSGSKGAEVSLTTGTFAGKKVASVMTGFKSALKRDKLPGVAEHGKNVAVIAKNERIFLVRRDLVTGAAAPEAPAADES